MEASLNLTELFRTALAGGAIGFTLRTGLHPQIYSAKGVQTYDTQPSTSEDIEEVLRQLVTSRELRQLRATGVVHFKSVFDGRISLLGGAKLNGEDLRVELRKLAAQPFPMGLGAWNFSGVPHAGLDAWSFAAISAPLCVLRASAFFPCFPSSIFNSPSSFPP
jgi:hypothetical protein